MESNWSLIVLYKMKNNFKNKIINGDSLKELKKIPSETFDLVFADPPYNLQLKNSLTRPDRTKVSAVNDKWDQFESFKNYDENKNFYDDKINTAKFYFDKVLPRAEQHYKSAISGSSNIMNFKFN